MQRDAAPSGQKSAQELIDDCTTLGMLDEEKLAKKLVAELPRQPNIATDALNKVAGHNKDDVSLEVFRLKRASLRDLDGALRLRMITELVDGAVVGEDETAVAELWISFESLVDEVPKFTKGLQSMIEKNQPLWKKSLWESDALAAYVKPVVDEFKQDVTGLTLQYLAENRKTLYDEAKRYGFDLGG